MMRPLPSSMVNSIYHSLRGKLHMLSLSCLEYLSSPVASKIYSEASPYPFLVIDGFFQPDIATAIAAEFPSYDAGFLDGYSNSIEEKKLVNHWNKFGSHTYAALSYLCGSVFVELISRVASDALGLQADVGLHGGGLHMHRRGGKLNVHLDYSLHPKLKLQRKLNLLVYLTPGWQPQWGGSLGLYGNKSADVPGELQKTIQPMFNRAVLFDVTRNSWHGLPLPIECPEGKTRNSLAVYYLQEPDYSVDPLRLKASFAPAPWQQGDAEVLSLIKRRSGLDTSRDVYDTQSSTTVTPSLRHIKDI